MTLDTSVRFVSTELAKSYGLNEAIVLHVLCALPESDSSCSAQDIAIAAGTISNFDDTTIDQAVHRLVELGVVECDEFEPHNMRLEQSAREFIQPCVDMNMQVQPDSSTLPGKSLGKSLGKFLGKSRFMPMHNEWAPSQEWLSLMADRGINRAEIDRELPLFRQYWLDRGEVRHSWGHVFFQRMTQKHNMFASDKQPITFDWQPSQPIWDYLSLDLGMHSHDIDQHVQAFVEAHVAASSTAQDWSARFLQYIHSLQNGNVNTKLADPKSQYKDGGGLSFDELTLLRQRGVSDEFSKVAARNFWRSNAMDEAKVQNRTALIEYIVDSWGVKAHGNSENTAPANIDINKYLASLDEFE